MGQSLRDSVAHRRPVLVGMFATSNGIQESWRYGAEGHLRSSWLHGRAYGTPSNWSESKHEHRDLGIRLASSHTELAPAVQHASPTQQELGQVNSSISASAFNAQGVTLAELESMAIERNPSLQQLAASICKAEGFRNQVGLRPNPVIGYQGVQLADRGTDQHTFFVERKWLPETS